MRREGPTVSATIRFSICPEYGCSTAELDPETKNKLSHRGKALEAIKEELRPFLEEEKR